MSATRPIKKTEIEYPSSDGKPMAETDTHRDWMFTNIDRLQRHFAGRKVYVSGNLLIYYVEGDPRNRSLPIPLWSRTASRESERFSRSGTEREKARLCSGKHFQNERREDSREKKETYALIGVKEYFLYDPYGDWLKPPLQGFSLVHGTL